MYEEYLVARAREAIATDPRVAELNVRIEVRGNAIVVSGEVATSERREAIEELVRSSANDHEVVNLLEVVEPSPPEDSEPLT